jgi:hypothetical protein
MNTVFNQTTVFLFHFNRLQPVDEQPRGDSQSSDQVLDPGHPPLGHLQHPQVLGGQTGLSSGGPDQLDRAELDRPQHDHVHHRGQHDSEMDSDGKLFISF